MQGGLQTDHLSQIYLYNMAHSAQLMLNDFTLAEVLAMDLQQLQSSFPWLPVKIAQVC